MEDSDPGRNVGGGFRHCTGLAEFKNAGLGVLEDSAENIGMLEPGNTEPAYTVAGGVPEAWSAVLSPHFNKF